MMIRTIIARPAPLIVKTRIDFRGHEIIKANDNNAFNNFKAGHIPYSERILRAVQEMQAIFDARKPLTKKPRFTIVDTVLNKGE